MSDEGMTPMSDEALTHMRNMANLALLSGTAVKTSGAPWLALIARLDAAERERDEARAAQAWQPIESAPRNLDDVLVFSPDHDGFNCGGVFVAFCSDDEGKWLTHTPSGNMALNPTHWQPLPAPPKP